MPPQPQPRRRPPKPLGVKNSTVYKVVAVIVFVLIAYFVWKAYTHLPPPQPLQYPS